MNKNTPALMTNHTIPGTITRPNGADQPPKNSSVAMHDTVIMFKYSAMKNNPNRRPEYSVWKPPTSSVSASTKSNGARFVSATAVIRYTTNPTNCGAMNHRFVCACTMPSSDVVPARISTPTTDNVIASS